MPSVDGEDLLRWRRDGVLRWSPAMTTGRAQARRSGPYGSDRPSVGRRWGVLAGMLLLVQVMTGCSALGGPPDRLAEAEADARDTVADLVAEVGAQSDDRTRTADQIGRALAASPQADLISISGVDTADPDGVTAVLRVVGTGKDGSWLEPEWVSEEFCFELRFAPASPDVPADRSLPVACRPDDVSTTDRAEVAIAGRVAPCALGDQRGRSRSVGVPRHVLARSCDPGRCGGPGRGSGRGPAFTGPGERPLRLRPRAGPQQRDGGGVATCRRPAAARGAVVPGHREPRWTRPATPKVIRGAGSRFGLLRR